jgi:hypothetical protein
MDVIREALIELEVEGELAVLAPLRGLGAGTGLDDVLGEGDFEERLGAVDLDIGGAGRAAGAEERHTEDADLVGDDGVGDIEAAGGEGLGGGGSREGEESEERNGLHDERV